MDAISILSVLIPVIGVLLIGVVPALLPASVSTSTRWLLALLLLVVSIVLSYLTFVAPHPFFLVFLVPFWFGWILGASLLLLRSRK
jgi:hypothetical protein